MWYDKPKVVKIKSLDYTTIFKEAMKKWEKYQKADSEKIKRAERIIKNHLRLNDIEKKYKTAAFDGLSRAPARNLGNNQDKI